jgi:predicted metal-dependent enzyme (double-stranded beta helix superfamily)
MKQERDSRMWREIGTLLERDSQQSTQVEKAGGRAAESIRVATERDHALYETYLHDFSDGRDVS